MAKLNHKDDDTADPSMQVITLSQLKKNLIIWYKVHVLIYDLCNVAKDTASQRRLEATTDVQYLSGPYFSESESILLKSAVVEEEGRKSTIEEALQNRFKGFIDKRKASGDYRPCGPRDLGMVYKSVFGIENSELENESFLSRLQRTGLGDNSTRSSDETMKNQHAGKQGKKGKNKK